MFCQKCGAEMPESDSTCPSCGASIENVETVAATPQKSRLVYALLGWFLGMFGVHNFYAGRIGRGIAQLILTLTCVGGFISAIWVIVDLFSVTTDRNGVEMSSKKGGLIVAFVALAMIFFNLLFFLAIMGGMLLPAFGSARGRAQAISCTSNLKQVGIGITMYADDNDGELPEAKGKNGMDEIEDKCEELISEKCFKCPANGDECYVYIRPDGGKLNALSNPGTTPLIYCNYLHNNRYVVLFADGHVESITVDDAAKYGIPR